MTSLRQIVLALTVVAALLSTGCIEALKIAEGSLRLTGAIIEIAAAASAGSGGSSACCYTRENPTPVDQPVDRSMTECELARGRHRETHQDEDDVPPELRCLADGSYPKVSLPPAAPPVEPPPAAEAEACEPAAPPAEAPAAPPAATI